MNPGWFKTQDPEKRLLSHIQKSADGCWLWTGAVKSSGYGHSWFNGRKMAAHRLAWTIWRGPIPDGMEIDHLCHVRHCVNPDHLRLASRLVNARSRLRDRYLVLVDALSEIRDRQGQVCPAYEICSHVACESSYSAWAIADKALKDAA